ncbi:MAG: hypothetical protein RRA15_04830 [bacterium]|nr:hypothetical protein [bacterium]MDT8365800.1 hypothetical protein [bacterium]
MSKDVHKCKGSDSCHEENHMCKIVIRQEFDRVREIVRDSEYYCKLCGRAAHNEANLCKPARI